MKSVELTKLEGLVRHVQMTVDRLANRVTALETAVTAKKDVFNKPGKKEASVD